MVSYLSKRKEKREKRLKNNKVYIGEITRKDNMGIAKITRNYQITIPKDVREIKDLKEGDSIVFTLEGNKIQLVKMNKDSVKIAAGLWSKTKESGVVYEKRMRMGWKKRLEREI